MCFVLVSQQYQIEPDDQNLTSHNVTRLSRCHQGQLWEGAGHRRPTLTFHLFEIIIAVVVIKHVTFNTVTTLSRHSTQQSIKIASNPENSKTITLPVSRHIDNYVRRAMTSSTHRHRQQGSPHSHLRPS